MHQSYQSQDVFPMELEESKEKALLFWFNTYGTSINLGIVNSLSLLWCDHLPSLLNCLRTNENTRITALSALSSYESLFSHFLKASVHDEIITSLSVEKAAAGDALEIAKFLAVLLNEFRISKPDVITESVAVMQRDGHDVPLKEILSAFDGESSAWWSVMIKRSDACITLADSQYATPRWSSLSVEEFSGMSVGQPSFATPCGPNRRRISSVNLNFHTVARCGGSPLMDTINSPKVRELRREREIKALRRQLNEIEDQLMNSESQVSESTTKIESLIGEIAKKNERIRSLESSGKLSQRSQEELEAKVVVLTKQLEGYKRQCDSQKERLAAYKVNVEELEEKQMVLGEQLETKGGSMAVLEAELRNVKDEAVKSLQQVRILDNERNTLIRLLEEERRAAKSEREQYQGAISDWRKRLETETANAMSLYTNEMEKNALLQQEIREKTEKFEKTRVLYESDKRSCENAVEEIKRRLQGKHDAAMKSLAQAKAKLFRHEARHKKFVSEHEAFVQQLESVHLAEIIQRDVKINAACTRIEELEAIVVDREHTILELRKDLANITAEKDATDSKLSNVQIVLEEKEDRLIEATIMIEKLKEDMGSITSKYNDTNRSLEIVQAECLELQSTVNRRDVEISEHVNDLKSLAEAHSKALDELKQTKQYLEEERKLLQCQDSEASAVIEDLMEKLMVSGDRVRHHAGALLLLEERSKSICCVEQTNEEFSNEACGQLHENITVKRRDLLTFLTKCNALLSIIFFLFEIIDELKLQIEYLSGKSTASSNCFYTPNFNDISRQTELREAMKSLMKSDASVNDSCTLPTENLELLKIEELQFCAMETSHGELKQIEDKSAANCVPSSVYNGLQPSHHNDFPNIASRSNSVASSVHSGVGRSASMPKSNSSKLPSVESYALEAKHCANLDTDRSRVNELQRRSAILHPAMRCAYATEVTAYDSPSGSENVVKHGSKSAKRKTGMKFFLQASSYVKRKLTLSDSSNRRWKHS